jgi:hypothetical protein
VWTAPALQGGILRFFGEAGWSGHVFGLFSRPDAPLAMM